MTQDMRVALITSLKDQLVGPLRRSLDEVEKQFQKIEGQLNKTTQASAQTERALGGMQGPARAAREAAELSRNTQNALTLAERLKNVWTQTGNVMRGAMTGFAAYQAAKYVMAPALEQQRNYDMELAHAANTAFAGASLGRKRAGIGELNAAVESAVRSGGGTREQTLQGLQKLLANGIEFDQAKATLPGITKAATASGASTVDISEIVTKLLKDGFNPKAIEDAIGKAIAAGQAGSFEMKDMAQWIPKLLAGGKMSGMRGMADYERMLAMAQVSATTAGGSAEAGNNLLNFLLKINSADTANDAKKLGIDLSGTLAAAREKGISAPDAFISLLRKSADADPRMVQLNKKFVDASSDSERMESLKAQEAILSGSAVGKWLQDRQALMPVIALLNNPKEYERTLGIVRAGGAHTTQDNFALISERPGFRQQQYENEKLFALTSSAGGANAALANLADKATALYREYPGFATVVETAKWAIGGLAAAAAAAGAAQWLLAKNTAEAIASLPKVTPPPGSPTPAALIPTGAVVTGAVFLGGGLATLAAGSTVANNSEYFANMGADAGDTAFAAAIMNASKEGQAQRDAEAAERAEFIKGFANRPVKLYIDGREIAAEVEKYMGLDAQRR